jgi:2-polyprenyl-3-methyl-5-hydroxy-6-metoxy-1,4-benzoquinol methylase
VHSRTPEEQAFNDRSVAERSDVIAAAVRAEVPDAAGATVIDYGCGAGHVGLRLAGHFGRVIMIDSAAEAVAEARAAVAAARAEGRAENVSVMELDLVEGAAPGLSADVVVSSLSWHHIQDLRSLLAALARLAPGGQLIVADMDADGGAFHVHVPGFDGHHGFDREALTALVVEAGCSQVRVRDLWQGDRWLDGELVPMSVFLLSARLPEAPAAAPR